MDYKNFKDLLHLLTFKRRIFKFDKLILHYIYKN